MGNVWCVIFILLLLSQPCICMNQIPDPLSYNRAVGRDPAYFPDPEKFDPQRWLTKEGKLKEEMKSFPFGFGRRCLLLVSLLCFLTIFFFYFNNFYFNPYTEYVLDNIWLPREFLISIHPSSCFFLFYFSCPQSVFFFLQFRFPQYRTGSMGIQHQTGSLRSY